MTRADIAQRVRDLLEEEGPSVLTVEALRRMIDRAVAEVTKRSRSILVSQSVALKANLATYPAPEAALGIVYIAGDPSGSSVTIQGPDEDTPYVYTWPSGLGSTDPAARAARLLWSDYVANRSLNSLVQGTCVFFFSPQPYFLVFTASAPTVVKTQVLPMSPAEVVTAAYVLGGTKRLLDRQTQPAIALGEAQVLPTPFTGEPRLFSVDGGTITLYPTPSAPAELQLLVAYEHPTYPQDPDGDALPLLVPERGLKAVSAYAAAEAAVRLRDRENTAELVALFRADYEYWLSRMVAEDAVVRAGVASAKTMP